MGGIGGGSGQKQKTLLSGGLGLDGSLHTMSNLGSIREEGSDEEDEDPVSYLCPVFVLFRWGDM